MTHQFNFETPKSPKYSFLPLKNMELTPDHIRWFRLRRSGLITPFDSPVACARALGGIQAQMMPAAGIALWNRTRKLTNTSFQNMVYLEKSLVKLWGQRGTLHSYATEDWPLICGARSGTRVWWERKQGDDPEKIREFHRMAEKLEKAFLEHESLGRSGLRKLELGIEEDLLSPWGGLFTQLVKTGKLCHVRPKRGEGRFAHRANWLPDLEWTPPAPDHANIELARRYIKNYGPATEQDLAHWRGAPMGDVRRWLQALEKGGGLVKFDLQGKVHLLFNEDLPLLREEPPPGHKWPVLLLYRFDPLILAHKDKSWLLKEEHYKRVWKKAAHIEGTLLIKGKVAGAWRYKKQGRKLLVTVEPFRKLPKYVQEAVSRRGKGLAKFFGLKEAGCDFEGKFP